MSVTGFPTTTFTDASGSPLSFGVARISIDNDVQSPNGMICRGVEVSVDLDQNGVMTAIPQVWPNASLLPLGSCYILKAYTAAGELSLGPEKVTV